MLQNFLIMQYNKYYFIQLLIWSGLFLYCHGIESGFNSNDRDKARQNLQQADILSPRPPIVFIPGVAGSRMVAWKQKQCIGPNIEIQDIVWLNLQRLLETLTYDKRCWLDCMKLEKDGSDPPDCKIRPDVGLGAVGELSPGNIITPPTTSIFTSIIRILAYELGYDSSSMIAAPYDWRLSPKDLQVRYGYFTSLKQKIESVVLRNKRPAIIVAHSMGNNLFLYFCNWLQLVDKPPGGWKKWIRVHIWSVVGYAAPLLGAPSALKAVLSGHTFGLPISDSQARELLLTFPSTLFVNPRQPPGSYTNRVLERHEDILATLKTSTGEPAVNISVNDVINGNAYKLSGTFFNDSKILQQIDVLERNYLSDPLQPLSLMYKRPPVRHVIMVYGVDLPTESSYVYRIPESVPGSNNQSVNGPLLEEIRFEDSSTCAAPREMQSDIDVTAQDLSHFNGPENIIDEHSMKRTNKARNLFQQAINSLNKEAHLKATGYRSEKIASSQNPPNVSDIKLCPNGEICLIENKNIESEEESKPDAFIASIQDEAIFSSDYLDNSEIIPDGKPRMIISRSSDDKDVESCKAGIYAVKPNRLVTSRTFLHNSTTSRSGDNTVSYASLSFAKTWLDEVDTFVIEKGNDEFINMKDDEDIDHVKFEDISFKKRIDLSAIENKGASPRQWQEHIPARLHNAKHILDNWAQHNKIIDPAIDIFYAHHHNNDSTVVMEVSGVDHLAIAKNAYVFKQVMEHLLSFIMEDLCLDSSSAASCRLYNEENSSS